MIQYSPDVKRALTSGEPVVALESTIITHGFSYPFNLEVACRLEEIVRHAGAVPASIAILNGVPKIGLSMAELETLAKGDSIEKTSARDIAGLMTQRRNGATTVAATLRLAHLAGISVFATGGIGGVHRGAESHWDVSADLLEMAQCPVLIVAAGAKSILDLTLTLEKMETLGIPVIGYQTLDFPAFYCRSSGLTLQQKIEDAGEAARLAMIHWGLNGKGLLIANPIPASSEIPLEEIERIIDQAIGEAEKENIHGKKLTPYLLARVNHLTEGRSQTANRALAENNARLAAEIAVAIASAAVPE